MKMNFVLGLLLLAAPPEIIQRVTLDETVVVTVPVATNRVTTIRFPGPITASDAAGVTADGKTPGQFQLEHTKGSTFLSVRALARKAATNLNIRWNKHTYVFELEESDTPVLALNLEDRSKTEIVLPAPLVTPTQLLALLDKAKAFAWYRPRPRVFRRPGGLGHHGRECGPARSRHQVRRHGGDKALRGHVSFRARRRAHGKAATEKLLVVRMRT